MKRPFKHIALSLSAASLAFAAPLAAQDTTSSEPTVEELEQVMGALTGMFQAEPLTAEQEARLPAAEAIVATMMPEGFYAELMSDMMGDTFAPIMAMFSGETGAQMMLSTRLATDPAKVEALSAEERSELVALLDPGFEQRGEAMGGVFGEMMTEVATLIEPGFRQGMARAYAVRFTADQLADISAFYATPTGEIYAQQTMALFTDPQVMSASMEAMPAMMGQFADMETRVSEKMAELPAERSYEDLSADERARMAQLLGLSESELSDTVQPPRAGGGSPF